MWRHNCSGHLGGPTAPGIAGLLREDRPLEPLVPRHISRVQLVRVHERVDPLERDPALDHEHNQLGQHVEGGAQQVEVGQTHEGRLRVEHVGLVDEDVGGEGGDGHEEGGAGPEERGESAEVGGLYRKRTF